MTATKKRFLTLALPSIVAILVAACGGQPTAPSAQTAAPAQPAQSGQATSAPKAAGSDQPYTIGVNEALTGAVAELANSVYGGLVTYVDWLDKQGGVNGHPLKLEVLDNRLDVPTGVANNQQLVDKGALVIVGPTSSGVWTATGPLAAKAKVAQISGAGVDQFLYPSPEPWLFRAYMSGRSAIDLQVAFIEQEIKKTGNSKPRIASMFFDTPAVNLWNDTMKQVVAQKGWPWVAQQIFPMTATDLSSQAAAIVASKPDIIVACYMDPSVVLSVKALRELGYEGPIVYWGGGTSEVSMKALHDSKLFAARTWLDPSDPDPAAQEMMKRAQAAGQAKNAISDWFTSGYGTGMAIEAALKKCGWPCTPTQLRDNLESLSTLDAQGLSSKLGLSKESHLMVKFGALWVWDQSKSHTVRVTDWLPIS